MFCQTFIAKENDDGVIVISGYKSNKRGLRRENDIVEFALNTSGTER